MLDYVMMLTEDQCRELKRLVADIPGLQGLVDCLELDTEGSRYIGDVSGTTFIVGLLELKEKAPTSILVPRLVHIGKLQDPDFNNKLDRIRQDLARVRY